MEAIAKERYLVNPFPPQGSNIELMEGGQVYILKAGQTYKNLPDKIIDIALARWGFLKEISSGKSAEEAVEAQTRLPTETEAPAFNKNVQEMTDTTERRQARIEQEVSGEEFYGPGLEDDVAS